MKPLYDRYRIIKKLLAAPSLITTIVSWEEFIHCQGNIQNAVFDLYLYVHLAAIELISKKLAHWLIQGVDTSNGANAL